MQVNKEAKRILCYGDSNTFGQRDNKDFTARGRLFPDERWTGILQEKLDDDFEIIEEGQGGRLTNIEDHARGGKIYKPPRNGFEYFQTCIYSQVPLDLVLIMLGTNDLKSYYNRSAKDVAEAINKYIVFLKKVAPGSKPVILAPVILERLEENYPVDYDKAAENKSIELVDELRIIASKDDVLFYDVNEVAKVGHDGVHLSNDSHLCLAAALSGIIQNELALLNTKA